jgi:hypothetical protein
MISCAFVISTAKIVTTFKSLSSSRGADELPAAPLDDACRA